MKIHKEWLGRKVMVEIDRPAGSMHPLHGDIVFPIHYGFIPGTRAEDGRAIDIYVLDPVEAIDIGADFEATVVAIIHRLDDGEDKLAVSTTGLHPTKDEVESAVEFQEQWFKHTIEVLRVPGS